MDQFAQSQAAAQMTEPKATPEVAEITAALDRALGILDDTLSRHAHRLGSVLMDSSVTGETELATVRQEPMTELGKTLDQQVRRVEGFGERLGDITRRLGV